MTRFMGKPSSRGTRIHRLHEVTVGTRRRAHVTIRNHRCAVDQCTAWLVTVPDEQQDMLRRYRARQKKAAAATIAVLQRREPDAR